MIAILRQRGVIGRHWKMISKELGHNLNMKEITVMRMIQLRLYEYDSMKVIRGICEIAMKEYAI